MQPGTYRVQAAGGLWLREGPGTDKNALLLMADGASVETDAQGTEQNGFAHVYYGKVEGWAAVKFLVPATGGGAQPAASGAPNYEITGQDVALRSAPEISSPDAYGPSSNVVTFTNKGEVVSNDGTQQNGFALVTYKGAQGWMSLRFLTGTDKPRTAGAVVAGTLAQPVAQPATYVELDAVTTEAGMVKGSAVAPFLLLLAGVVYFLAK